METQGICAGHAQQESQQLLTTPIVGEGRKERGNDLWLALAGPSRKRYIPWEYVSQAADVPKG